MEHKSYYAIIPANVRYDKKLTPNAKLLYGEITALCNEKGYCWARNSYFMELYGKSQQTISNWIKQLKDSGYINVEITYKQDSKEIDKRIIRIGPGIQVNNDTYTKKQVEPTQENLYRGIQENLLDNNTSSNITKEYKEEEEEIFEMYQNEIGIPSPLVIDLIKQWVTDYPIDYIKEAIKVSVLNGVRKPKYIEAVLKDWQKNGINRDKPEKKSYSKTNIADKKLEEWDNIDKEHKELERLDEKHNNNEEMTPEEFKLWWNKGRKY